MPGPVLHTGMQSRHSASPPSPLFLSWVLSLLLLLPLSLSSGIPSLTPHSLLYAWVLNNFEINVLFSGTIVF